MPRIAAVTGGAAAILAAAIMEDPASIRAGAPITGGPGSASISDPATVTARITGTAIITDRAFMAPAITAIPGPHITVIAPIGHATMAAATSGAAATAMSAGACRAIGPITLPPTAT